MSGTFTAIDSTTNKIVWQHKTPYRLGGGATVTAGGLVFRGEPDGNFLALDAKTGQELWRVQTSSSARPPPLVFLGDWGQNAARASRGDRRLGRGNRDSGGAVSLLRA